MLLLMFSIPGSHQLTFSPCLLGMSQLASTQAEISLRMLQIFAYGTYSDYKNLSGAPVLKPEQLHKLKLLSLVSMAHKSKVITYDALMTSLDIGSLRELEDLIIDAMYKELISGKMNPKLGVVNIDVAFGRDLRPGQLTEMISLFDSWADNCAQLLSHISTEMDHANASKAASVQHESAVQHQIEEAKKMLKLTKELDSNDAKKP
eukprot:m.172423 g.172423  ORF g.172423 m.172423 type:complete len:205 (-) comp18286_c0_seq7:302-916(-)